MKKILTRTAYVLLVIIKVPFLLLSIPWLILDELDAYMDNHGWW